MIKLKEYKTSNFPWSIFWLSLILCSIPFLLSCMGIDFASHAVELTVEKVHMHGIKPDDLFHAHKGASHHALLEWSAVTIAMITVLLSFSHYSIKKDVTTPIIGMALFCSGIMDAFHTLAALRLIDANADNSNLIPFTWALSRTFNATILIIGACLVLKVNTNKSKGKLRNIFLISLIFGATSYYLIQWAVNCTILPQTQYPDALITRPFDVLPLVLFVFSTFLFWKLYKYNRNLLTISLVMAVIPHAVLEAHMAFGSTQLFDSHFNIAHLLKIVAYGVPCIGLILDYINTYRDQQKMSLNLRLSEHKLKGAIKSLEVKNVALEEQRLVVIRKNSEVNNAMKELDEKAKQLKLLVEYKSDFLANMSHELRTPLNGIIGFSELLIEDKLSVADRQQMVQIIYKSGNSLLTIVNDILDFSKIEKNKMKLEHIDFGLKQLLNDLHTIMIGFAEEKQIDFVVSYDKDLPEVLIGDAGRLRQVLLNLLNNAIKFTNKGNVLLSIKIVQLKKSEVTMMISVKDSGIGISKNKIETIFNQFEQADASTTRKFGGTGLGLAISKSIVTLMGSELKVKSKLKEGSEFSFTLVLPISNTKLKNPSEFPADLIFNTDDKPINILICEDNKLNQKLISRLCTNMNLTVDVAENGAIGVDKVRQNHYALVLMDMQMPVLDGLEATRKIRELGYVDLPILALTANAFERDKQKCIDSGMNDFQTKPIKKLDLFLMIEKWLLITSEV